MVKKVQNAQNQRILLLCIDSYENRITEGFLYCLSWNEKHTFYGLMHMLDLVNRTLEDAQTRQTPTDGLRTFGKPIPHTVPENESLSAAHGKQLHLPFVTCSARTQAGRALCSGGKAAAIESSGVVSNSGNILLPSEQAYS